MLKLSNILRSKRSAAPEEMLMRKVSKTVNAVWAHNFTSVAASTGNRTNKIFTDYTVYKGKAALSVGPLLPKFNQSSEISSKYDKKGCILMRFWPAIGERKYDWEKRQIFALSPTELGSLISLEPGKSCEFFHDPYMKSSNAGQVRKSLSVSPMPEDSGYFFSLSVTDGIQKTNERFSVPVTKAEFTVMRTAFSYILPHIMGWDHVTKQELPSMGMGMNQGRQQEMGVSPKYEWDR